MELQILVENCRNTVSCKNNSWVKYILLEYSTLFILSVIAYHPVMSGAVVAQ